MIGKERDNVSIFLELCYSDESTVLNIECIVYLKNEHEIE